jgi:metal-responsive CopG/Arc/MetJ family transcriptional regulator
MERTTTITAGASSAANWGRKVSIAISMPQRLIEEIDTVRGDIPRSVFVCKILRAQIKSEKEEAEENE